MDRVPAGTTVDCVIADNRLAAANATRHLLTQSHQRIAFLGDAATLMTAQERLAGYREAMTEAGVAVDPRWVRLDVHSLEQAEQAVRELLADPDRPTALFTAQNYVTMGACRALHRLSLQSVIALTGFDDFPMADVLEPGVTVVEQDARRMGREAAEVLFARMDGDATPVMTRTVPCTFIPRGSGEIPPA